MVLQIIEKKIYYYKKTRFRCKDVETPLNLIKKERKFWPKSWRNIFIQPSANVSDPQCYPSSGQRLVNK